MINLFCAARFLRFRFLIFFVGEYITNLKLSATHGCSAIGIHRIGGLICRNMLCRSQLGKSQCSFERVERYMTTQPAPTLDVPPLPLGTPRTSSIQAERLSLGNTQDDIIVPVPQPQTEAVE